MNPLEKPPGKPESPPPDAEQQMRRLSRRSFAVFGGAAAAGVGGWLWLRLQSQDAGIPWFLRKAPNFNAKLAEAYFKPSRLSPTYSKDLVQEPRPNGPIGLTDPRFDPDQWKLNVELPGGKGTQKFSLDDIKSLPRVELLTELKCIEGWSVVVHWSGARLADFLTQHSLGLRDPAAPPAPSNWFDFVQLETPDRGYYVGLDMASAMHPQTLLCYELNGKPLTLEHGSAAAAGDPGEIRHQKYQANRHDPLSRHPPRRLLGGARLRLVRRIVAGTLRVPSALH